MTKVENCENSVKLNRRDIKHARSGGIFWVDCYHEWTFWSALYGGKNVRFEVLGDKVYCRAGCDFNSDLNAERGRLLEDLARSLGRFSEEQQKIIDVSPR